jgi:hypothetical protein
VCVCVCVCVCFIGENGLSEERQLSYGVCRGKLGTDAISGGQGRRIVGLG